MTALSLFVLLVLVLGVKLDTEFLRREIVRMNHEIEVLKAAVEAEGSVVQSAIVLLQGLATRLRAASAAPDEVLALAAQLDGQRSALADAVAANTVAEEIPVAAPPTTPAPAPEPAPAATQPAPTGPGTPTPTEPPSEPAAPILPAAPTTTGSN